jgi:hypothetical protein
MILETIGEVNLAAAAIPLLATSLTRKPRGAAGTKRSNAVPQRKMTGLQKPLFFRL